MSPTQFNNKLFKHFKQDCYWQLVYDTYSYKVTIYKYILIDQTKIKSNPIIGVGVGTTQQKAFEDCLDYIKNGL